MNFNYSYRAFLITCLLTGCLVLILYSIKLHKIQSENREITYDVEIFPDELIPDETLDEADPESSGEIETNKAFNEAEQFIKAVENENRDITESTQEKLQELDKALAGSNNTGQLSADMLSREKQNPDIKESDKDREEATQGSNKNTTISYRLINRTDISLPNPVYTCYGAGKVVINIEVNQLGVVKKCMYNKSASTTDNQCLVEAATTYASQARFSTDHSRPSQLGTITFNFPGQ